MQILVHHFEEGRLARDGVWAFGRGDRAVLGVVVDEHLFRVARTIFEGDVSVGKQHFVAFRVGEVYSVVGYPADRQCLVASCL